jgi:hypothetical protein
MPTAHALAANLKFSSDLRLCQLASGEQPRNASTPLLHCRKISPGRTGAGHANILPPDRRIVTLLGEVQ